VPIWKRNRHIDRWLAQGQAEYEEQVYQRQKTDDDREKYNV